MASSSSSRCSITEVFRDFLVLVDLLLLVTLLILSVVFGILPLCVMADLTELTELSVD